jgi:hypothetical protein
MFGFGSGHSLSLMTRAQSNSRAGLPHVGAATLRNNRNLEPSFLGAGSPKRSGNPRNGPTATALLAKELSLTESQRNPNSSRHRRRQ